MTFFVPHIREQLVVTYAAALTIDFSQSDLQKVTLAGNAVITLANAQPGQEVTVEYVQDGTGSRVPTYAAGTTILWSGGTHTLSTTAAAIDMVTYTCVGVNTFRADLKTAYA